jgi:hypothetical protein
MGLTYDFHAVIIAPFAFVPFVGLVVSAGVKALATSEFLHRPYFADKKMTPVQVAIFVEERKWEYRGMWSVYVECSSSLMPWLHGSAMAYTPGVVVQPASYSYSRHCIGLS